MGAFWEDAQNIFETAVRATDSADCDWTILIGGQGGIQMVDGSGWALPSLLAHRGAETAYRITRDRGQVRLEGRNRSQTCLLQSESPAALAHRLLAPPVPGIAGTSSPLPLLHAAAAPMVELWKMFA